MALYHFLTSYFTLTFPLLFTVSPRTQTHTLTTQPLHPNSLKTHSKVHSLAVPMTSAPRSIFRMNLNIFTLFFLITVIPFHALSLSCAEPSTLLIIQHLHPYSQISYLPKSLYHTIRMLTSRLVASCIATQFHQHAPPIRIFVTFSPALSLVSQHCKPVTSYIKPHAKTARPHIADRHLDLCTNAFRSMSAILDLPPISSNHQH